MSSAQAQESVGKVVSFSADPMPGDSDEDGKKGTARRRLSAVVKPKAKEELTDISSDDEEVQRIKESALAKAKATALSAKALPKSALKSAMKSTSAK